MLRMNLDSTKKDHASLVGGPNQRNERLMSKIEVAAELDDSLAAGQEARRDDSHSAKLALVCVNDAPLRHQCGFTKKRDGRDHVKISAVVCRRQMKCGFVLRLHESFLQTHTRPCGMATTDCSVRDCVVSDDSVSKRAIAKRWMCRRTARDTGPRIFRGVHDDAIPKWSETKDTPRELYHW